MSSVLDMLTDALGREAVDQIGRQLRIDPAIASVRGSCIRRLAIVSSSQLSALMLAPVLTAVLRRLSHEQSRDGDGLASLLSSQRVGGLRWSIWRAACSTWATLRAWPTPGQTVAI